MVRFAALADALRQKVRRLPYELYLALRYLRFQRGHTFLSLITLISVAGVTVGTAALVIALALMTGFQNDVRERILGGSAHLTVLSSAEPTFTDAETLAARLREVPGIRATTPVLSTPAMIVNEEINSPGYAELQAIDPPSHGQVIPLDGPDGDPLRGLAEAPDEGVEGIVLGAQLAERIAVRSGDRVRVVVPRMSVTPFAAVPRSRVFRVVGTFRSEFFQQDAQRAYVALRAGRRLLDAPSRASWIEIRLEDARGLKKGKDALRLALGPDWSVVDLIEQNRPMLKALNTEKLFLFLAIGLIVVVASLNIVSTLILMVNDKIKEIGTLTAMGARPGGIATIFISQGAVIGLVGTSAGLILGTAVSYWFDRYRMIPLNPDVYYLDHVPFSTRPADMLFVGVLALAVSLLATIYPAWRAAFQDPVEAIRHE